MKPTKVLAIVSSQGELEKMRQILAVDASLAKDWQPIMDACYFGQVEAVELLLASGADANVLAKSQYKYRPLHRTVEKKISVPRTDRHVKIAETLLEHGADPMLYGSPYNVSAIALAAFAGDRRFLDRMLPKAPALDFFHLAALGRAEEMKLALSADPGLAKAKDSNGMTAIRYASMSGMGDKDPSTALALECAIRVLVDAGADVSDELDRVVFRNKPMLVELMLSKGARLKDGDTLNHAACDGSFEALDVLVRTGVDLNMTAGTEHHGGYTPFGCTLTLRSLKGATWFLDQGVDPNYVGGKSGESSLHVAVRSAAGPDLLKLLIARGANPGAKDAQGLTPLDAAIAKGHQKALDLLSSL